MSKAFPSTPDFSGFNAPMLGDDTFISGDGMRGGAMSCIKSVLLAGLLLWQAGTAMAQAPGYHSAVILPTCAYDCLIDHLRRYVDALDHKDASRLPLSARLRFTENNVEMPLGNDGLWASISKVRPDALEVADVETGNAAWFGIVEEHGNPAYLALRLKVEGRQITEIETVVNRLPDMPKPFGNPDEVEHDPAFKEILAPAERRSRERLIAVADGYFSTVELNDGAIFTPFHEDCQRNENGISTTRATGTGSAAIAQGCEEQFKLGIFRINKQIRERRYPLVDVERGVVVATGFFDHANRFDRYTLTDGREMKTLLKWPNSITLLEAFKIRDGKIYRIEAVFTYVPYFMHSPFAQANPDFQTR
ncbi:MAG: hypothetical protein RQ899_14720 [Pseudomonadales bacterium]|nr:hypothetical protein [Pseudomonadales bacterium]